MSRAVWTRFHPLAAEIAKVLASGKLGKPKRFSADFSMDSNPDGLSHILHLPGPYDLCIIRTPDQPPDASPCSGRR